MKKLSALVTVATLLLWASPAHAVDSISFNASLTQSINGTSITIAAGTHIVVLVDALCRSGGTTTGVTVGAVSATQINAVATNTITSGDQYSHWIALMDSTTGSQAVTTSGCSGTIRVAALALNGVDQTTGYNSAATNICDSAGSVAGYSCAVTTQYDNSWVAGAAISASGTFTADANSTFPNNDTYVTGYTTSAQTPVGSQGIGATNTTSFVFLVAEIIPFGATIAGGGPANFVRFLLIFGFD